MLTAAHEKERRLTRGVSREELLQHPIARFLTKLLPSPTILSRTCANLEASGLEKEPGSPLFPAALGKTGKLSRRPLVRTDAADMLKRRLKQAGLPAHYSPHSFRATGITNFLENDGSLEAAQRMAGHADSRTTKLYDRRGQKVLLEDMERIRY